MKGKRREVKERKGKAIYHGIKKEERYIIKSKKFNICEKQVQQPSYEMSLNIKEREGKRRGREGKVRKEREGKRKEGNESLIYMKNRYNSHHMECH